MHTGDGLASLPPDAGNSCLSCGGPCRPASGFLPVDPAWSAAMQKEPFFTRDGARFLPTPSCRGPWNPKSLHGRVVIGLLGQEIELRHGGPDYLPARLTVDMYRLP